METIDQNVQVDFFEIARRATTPGAESEHGACEPLKVSNEREPGQREPSEEACGLVLVRRQLSDIALPKMST